MRVYLHSTQLTHDLFKTIKEKLSKAGIIACSRTQLDFDWKAQSIVPLSDVADHVDLFITSTISVSAEDLGALSLAAARRIPCLCLHERGTLLPETIAALLHDSSLRRLIRLVPHLQNEASCRLLKILQEKLKNGFEKRAPLARFTVRLPINALQALSVKASEHQRSKAGFLRDMLQEVLGLNGNSL